MTDDINDTDDNDDNDEGRYNDDNWWARAEV